MPPVPDMLRKERAGRTNTTVSPHTPSTRSGQQSSRSGYHSGIIRSRTGFVSGLFITPISLGRH
eukprot:5186623-Alexandrium_andersonii.AAC.1